MLSSDNIKKWINSLNVRVKTTKLLEENVVQNPSDFGFDKEFLHMTPKAQDTKDTNR